MAVLVTGGAGYIGSHMVLALVESGDAVVVLDDLSTGFGRAVLSPAKLVVGDVGDHDLVARIIAEHKIEEIVHFAAKTVVPESVRDPLGYYHANTVKTRDLIETAVLTGVKRFVFSSTAAVYGEPEVSPVSETVAPMPINPYGRSKLMSEWILEDTARAHDIAYVALRYFNVAGADPQGRAGQSTPDATHLIKVACQAVLGKRPHLRVYGTDYPTRDGTCVRDYVQVSDLVDAHSLALRHLREGCESLVLNCGYGHGFTVLEVIQALKRVSGIDVPVELVGRRAGDPASVVAEATAIRTRLGWQPRHDNLEEIVRQALNWERSSRNAEAEV